jgi:hypothetical protein
MNTLIFGEEIPFKGPCVTIAEKRFIVFIFLVHRTPYLNHLAGYTDIRKHCT